MVSLCLAVSLLAIPPAGSARAEQTEIQTLLSRPILRPRQTEQEVEAYAEPRVPRLRVFHAPAEWDQEAGRIRAAVLERVVYRGQAAAWRDAPLHVQWQQTIAGGPGYRIKKLRYEAVPGLWIPALLYEPEKLAGKVPAVLNVNGHDGNGKAAPYKQIRCINQVRRGMLALNVEWLGMGQLRSEGFAHGRMNQLDLCGTSGLAVFYLAMRRGLDVLLSLPSTDNTRVAVTGLSGGGWQTIFLSSLDPRVQLADPVAGYSSLLTHLRHHKDLGDSEQTPTDLATVADYTHLTALRAPRPTLLTYNSKDDCCFEAGYALPPLLDAARPIFKLYGRENALRSHVNDDPGTHNYERDNRQALYRMLGDFFYPGDAHYSAREIPCSGEVKTAQELAVDLPADNRDFQRLARALSQGLPVRAGLPESRATAREWQRRGRARLQAIVRAQRYAVRAEKADAEARKDLRVTFWRLKVGDAWTVPAVEFVRGTPKGTTLLLNDAGRRSDPVNVERLLAAGRRVLAVDPFYFGESRLEGRDYLFALLVAALGDRPLGIQASQVAAVARWAAATEAGPVKIVAVGPRLSMVALVAGGLEERAIGEVELQGSLGSLKEIIEQNRSVEQMPELFCFGLLEAFDVKQLAALTAPRPLTFVAASPRARVELVGLKAWYKTLGAAWEPLR